MCANRQHRYTVEVKVGNKTHSVVVQATGAAEAVAKADGWAHINLPGEFHTFTVTHSTYRSVEAAQEHGAIMPTSNHTEWPKWVEVLAQS